MIQAYDKEYHYTETYNCTMWYATSYEFKLKTSIYNLWPEEIRTFIRSKILTGMGFWYYPFEIDYDLEIKLYEQDFITLNEMVSAYEEISLTELGRS